MDTREAAQRWAEAWERGWREHDTAATTALYAEDAFWQQHPFREPEPGYLARVFAEEESAQCQFGTPIVDGDQAAVPWSAQTRLKDGGTENLAGVSLLRFRADGLVSEERDFTPRLIHTPRRRIILRAFPFAAEECVLASAPVHPWVTAGVADGSWGFGD
jgi:hypothetical protein